MVWKTILGKTTETVRSSDLPAITAALTAYEELSDAAKAKLVDGEKSLLDALKAKAEEPQYIMGDVNGDGKITAQDLTMLTNRILGTTSPAFVEAAADINGDGEDAPTEEKVRFWCKVCKMCSTCTCFWSGCRNSL